MSVKAVAEDIVLDSVDDRGLATVTFNRPALHNAFDDALIEKLDDILSRYEKDQNVKALLVTARGKSFSAGADLKWMQRLAKKPIKDNIADAKKAADLLRRFNCFSKPTIAKVQGTAMGGGVGLVACCDIAVAAEDAMFAFSEVRLGLVPSVIAPYVLAAMGPRAARRYFLTGEKFSAGEAWRMQLIDEVVQANELDTAVEMIVQAVLKGSSAAQQKAKEIIRDVAWQDVNDAVCDNTAKWIAQRRASKDGQEGIAAFLEKRPPKWTEG